MVRRGRWALLLGFVPIVLVLACVGTRSIQGPVDGRAVLDDGADRDDLVARLRCRGYGVHGAHRTDEEIRVWTVMAVTALASALFAWIAPTRIGMWAGFVYPSLMITMPWIGIAADRKAQTLRREEQEVGS